MSIILPIALAFFATIDTSTAPDSQEPIRTSKLNDSTEILTLGNHELCTRYTLSEKSNPNRIKNIITEYNSKYRSTPTYSSERMNKDSDPMYVSNVKKWRWEDQKSVTIVYGTEKRINLPCIQLICRMLAQNMKKTQREFAWRDVKSIENDNIEQMKMAIDSSFSITIETWNKVEPQQIHMSLFKCLKSEECYGAESFLIAKSDNQITFSSLYAPNSFFNIEGKTKNRKIQKQYSGSSYDVTQSYKTVTTDSMVIEAFNGNAEIETQKKHINKSSKLLPMVLRQKNPYSDDKTIKATADIMTKSMSLETQNYLKNLSTISIIKK